MKNQDIQTKCKGIKKPYKKLIKFDHFKKCIQEVLKINVDQVQIRSVNHIIQTQKIKKIALSSFDDKRFMFNCSIHTVPYGSKYELYEICPFCIKEINKKS